MDPMNFTGVGLKIYINGFRPTAMVAFLKARRD